MIWVALGLLVLAAFVVTLPPLLKGAKPGPSGARDLAVYRDQLKEIDVDQERGLITAAEAEAARIEIKRRILALTPEATAPVVETPRADGARPVAVAVGLLLAAVSIGTYLALGRPDLPAKPYDPALERAAAAEDMMREVEGMVDKLAARLKTQPNDPTGWRMLGWSYLQMGRIDEGAAALKTAAAQDPGNSALRSLLGEALVHQAGGKVSPAALAAFDEALKRDAKDPRARFYKGLAALQAGKDAEAFEAWVAILRDGPKDADWVPGIRAQALELAKKLKRDAAEVP